MFFRLHSVFGTHLCWILIYVLLTTAFSYGIGKYLPCFCPNFLFYYLTSDCVHADVFGWFGFGFGLVFLLVWCFFSSPRAEIKIEKRKRMTFWPNWKQNMGIMLKKEEGRLQPRKERNKELYRLKYQVSLCMGTCRFGRISEFFWATVSECVCINLLWLGGMTQNHHQQERQSILVLLFKILWVLFS